MKKSVLTLFFWLTGSVLFAQEYHPLLDNPSWIIYRYYSGQAAPSPNKFVGPPEDVSVNSVGYKRFTDPYPTFSNPSGYVYLREDTAQRKVYRLDGDNEKLIYDFSLENGDTFTQDTTVYDVTVNDTTIGGVTRKKLILQLSTIASTSFRQIWIEGIGGTSHPLEPYYNVQSHLTGRHNWTHLKCAFQNDQHLYGLENCPSLLQTKAHEIAPDRIDVYPNPVQSVLTIRRDDGFEDMTVKIFNSLGQLVREVAHRNGQTVTIERNGLPSGFYLLQLIDNGQVLEAKKVQMD